MGKLYVHSLEWHQYHPESPQELYSEERLVLSKESLQEKFRDYLSYKYSKDLSATVTDFIWKKLKQENINDEPYSQCFFNYEYKYEFYAEIIRKKISLINV